MNCRPTRILVNCGCCPDPTTVSICELIIGLQAQPELPVGAQVPYILPDGTCGRAQVVGGSFDLCVAVSARPLGAQGVAGVTEFFGADCQRHVLPAAAPAFNLCTALSGLSAGSQGVAGVDSYIGSDCLTHVLPALPPVFNLCDAVAARPLGTQGVPGVTEFFGADCERHLLPAAPTPFNLCTALSGLAAGSQGVANVDSYVGADCLTHLLPAVPPAFNLCTAIAALPNGASGVPGVSKYVGDDCQLHILPPSGAAVGGQNALNSTVAPGFIELGGDLLHSTTVTLHDFPLVWNGGTGTSTSSMTQATAAWDVSSIFTVANEDTKFSLSPQLVTARYRSVTNGLLSGLNASSIICDLFHSNAAHTSELSLTAVNSFSRFTDAIGEASVTLATTRGRIQYQPVADSFAIAFAEVRNYIVELNTINDPGQIGAGVYTGLVKLTAYPNTRNESVAFVPTNFLYTDASGNVRSAPSSAMPPPSETPITPVDTSTIDLSVSGVANHTLQGVVRISANAGNTLTAVLDGLYVPTPGAFNLCTSIAGLPVGATDGSNYVGADCQIHALPSVPGETPLSVVDTSSIDFGVSGPSNHTLTGAVKISATAGNQATINADGIYVPASGGGTPGGSPTEVQYNNGGVFGGITGVTSSGTDLIATAGNLKATSPQITTGINESFGNPMLLFSPNNLAVNQFTIANAIAAGTPSLTATGADANINVRIDVKGTASLLSSALTLDLTTVSNGTSVRLAGAVHPAGSAAGGFLFPFVGGNQSSGPGVWWTSNAYGSTSGLWLNFGLNWQGANSSHSPFKIRKGTGTSADGAIVFNLYPDNGTIELFPFGVAAGNTSSIVFYELAANGSNTVSLRAPDVLAGNFVQVLPAAGNVNDVLTLTGVAGGVQTTGWVAPAGGAVAGSNKELQYNNAGAFGGATGFEYQPATSPNVRITAQGAALVALRLNSAIGQSASIFEVSADNGTTVHFGVSNTGAPYAPSGGSNSERFGFGSTLGSATNSVAFGPTAQITSGANNIALGQGVTLQGSNSILIGQGATAFLSSVIGLGAGVAPTAANQFVAGASAVPMTDVYFGKGVQNATPTAYTIHGTNAAGADIAGAAIQIAGGQGNGLGAGGSINFLTAPIGTTGSTPNNLAVRFSIDTSGLSTFTPIVTSGNGMAVIGTPTSGNLVSIAASGTGAASNAKTALNVATSGANTTSTQTSFGGVISNTSTGTSSTNIALQLTASGGTTNTALNVTAGQIFSSVNGALSAPAILANGTWITGGSATTTKPYVLIETSGATSTAWSTSGTGLGVNAASGFTGHLINLQLNGANRFKIGSTGEVDVVGSVGIDFSSGAGSAYIYTPATSRMILSVNGSTEGFEVNTTGVSLISTYQFGFTSGSVGLARDLILRRAAAANLAHGATDTDLNANIVSQIDSVQNALAGGTSNQAGKDRFFDASQGKGTGISGSHVFRVAPAGGTGTAVNALVNAIVIDSTGGLRTAIAGAAIAVATGTNQRAGNLTLIGGTLTVSNTTVTANTIVMLTRKTSGGTIGTSITYTVSDGVSFTVNSDNILDTSTFSYLLIEVN